MPWRDRSNRGLNKNMQGKVQLILLAVLVVVCVLGLAAFVGVNYGDDIKAMMHQEPDSSETKPLYVPMEKLVISVDSDKTIYFTMVEITLETGNEQSMELINYYMPVIRNVFVKSLSQRDFVAVRHYLKDIGKLQEELNQELTEVLERYKIAGIVDKVLITKLVIQ